MTMFIVLASNANNLPEKKTNNQTPPKKTPKQNRNKYVYFLHISMLISDSGVEITLIC
jgi:hypothetical protein